MATVATRRGDAILRGLTGAVIALALAALAYAGWIALANVQRIGV